MIFVFKGMLELGLENEMQICPWFSEFKNE
jgi:hypothetical protein